MIQCNAVVCCPATEPHACYAAPWRHGPATRLLHCMHPPIHPSPRCHACPLTMLHGALDSVHHMACRVSEETMQDVADGQRMVGMGPACMGRNREMHHERKCNAHLKLRMKFTRTATNCRQSENARGCVQGMTANVQVQWRPSGHMALRRCPASLQPWAVAGTLAPRVRIRDGLRGGARCKP